MQTRLPWAAALLCLGLSACSDDASGFDDEGMMESGSGTLDEGSDGEPIVLGTPWVWDLPADFPEPAVPDYNPLTVEKVELGHYLFYDTRLSYNETQSCGSCHEQALGFADGKATPIGSTGGSLIRNSQGLANVAYVYPLTWANPVLETLEEQIRVPLLGDDPVELGMAGHEDEIFARLRDDPRYVDLFEAAFPDDDDPFDVDHTVLALASFVRTMIAHDSPYDRFNRGDVDALSDSAKRGLTLFFSERLECYHCHGGFLLTIASVHAGSAFRPIAWQNTGLYNLDENGGYPIGNRGLYEFTYAAEDMGAFRPPGLRNVAVTGPYLHDGTIETLEEVLQIYERGGQLIEDGPLAGDGALNPHKDGLIIGFELTDQERTDIVAFLESLTDESFLTDPSFSDPFAESTDD